MLKKLLVTTALCGVMATAAMAQSPSPSSPSSPPAASPADQNKSNLGEPLKSDAPKVSTTGQSSTATSGSAGSASTIAAQKPDQLLASKMKGADVVGSDDKKIGDVSDILFSKDGKVEAYILSVGGFLGVGAKEVALAPSSIQLTQDKDSDNWKVKVSMTKDQLAQAPNFEHYKAQRTTTGAGPGGANQMGGGSATTPRSAPSGNPPANRP